MARLRTIVLAVDGSTSAHRALQWATDLAVGNSASLTILSVLPVQHVYSTSGRITTETRADDRRYIHELLIRYADVARKAGAPSVATALREGPVVDQLLAYLDEHRPDVVILGTRGLSPSKRLLLGSVSDAIVHHAQCAVLVIPPAHGLGADVAEPVAAPGPPAGNAR